MTKIIAIQSGYSLGRIEIPFNDNKNLNIGDEVIFQNEDKAEEYGVIKQINIDSDDKNKILFSSKILRQATPNDIQTINKLIKKGQESLNTCRQFVEQTHVNMNVFRCGYSFDEAKVHFTFTSEDRVDFRDLVKLLAKSLKKQIHLRQIGPRDKAKLVGGYGKCGRKLCCNTWLGKLESINMEMVRVQSLENKGSSKLSGSCGKLLCCLKYEIETYKELKKGMPRIGTIVSTGKNKGKVIALDILNNKIKLFLESKEVIFVAKEEIKILR